MNTTVRPTHAVVSMVSAVSDLVDTLRVERDRARDLRRPRITKRLDDMSRQMDAVRTNLVQQGEDYLEVAGAYLDEGRLACARAVVDLDRRASARGRLSLDCLDANHGACSGCDCASPAHVKASWGGHA